MKIRCVQLSIGTNVSENIHRALDLAGSKSLKTVDVLMFPELFTTGYQLPKIHELAHTEEGAALHLFKQFAIKNNVNLVLGSVAVKKGGRLFNTTYVLARNGTLISEYSKVHLFGLMNEEKYLSKGNKTHTFQLDNVVCSSVICYDLRFPEITRSIFVASQPYVFFVPMQWPKPRTDVFRTLLRARAIENQCFFVSCNRVGEENGTIFEGASLVADPYGKVIGEQGISEGLLDVTLDLSLVEKARKKMNCLNEREIGVYKNLAK